MNQELKILRDKAEEFPIGVTWSNVFIETLDYISKLEDRIEVLEHDAHMRNEEVKSE